MFLSLMALGGRDYYYMSSRETCKGDCPYNMCLYFKKKKKRKVGKGVWFRPVWVRVQGMWGVYYSSLVTREIQIMKLSTDIIRQGLTHHCHVNNL